MVKRVFATLYSLMRAMMVHVGLHKKIKTGKWSKCSTSTTKLENSMVNPYKEKRVHENLYGKMPDYAKYLSNFGEMGVIHSITIVK